jgi:hypothetical protein
MTNEVLLGMLMKEGVLVICSKSFRFSTIKFIPYFTSLSGCNSFFIVIKASKSVIFWVLAK